MSEVTHILEAIQQGQPQAAENCCLGYDELRKLVRIRWPREADRPWPRPLVHEGLAAARRRPVADPAEWLQECVSLRSYSCPNWTAAPSILHVANAVSSALLNTEQKLSDDLPRKFEARVELEQDGELLTGTLPVFGRGRSKIENQKRFDSRMARSTSKSNADRADNKLITIYTRKQTGDKIKGTIETTVDGEDRKFDLGRKAG